MNDPIYYELRVISIATKEYVKFYWPKPFPSIKESLEVFFNWIFHTHILQRLFETSVLPKTFNFVGLIIRRLCRLLSIYGFGWSASHSWYASYNLKRRTFVAHMSKTELSSTSRHWKSLRFHATFYSSSGVCAKNWFQTLNSCFFFLFFCFENSVIYLI